MSTVTLPRSIGTIRWNILADLHCARRPMNVRSTLDAHHGDRDILRMLMEGGLVTVHRASSGERVPFESAWFTNELDIHLTDRGRDVAARIYHLAGILLWLSRRHGRTVLQQVTVRAGCDRDDLGELNDRGYIAAYADPDTSSNPINLAIRLGEYRDSWVEITATGRRCTGA